MALGEESQLDAILQRMYAMKLHEAVHLLNNNVSSEPYSKEYSNLSIATEKYKFTQDPRDHPQLFRLDDDECGWISDQHANQVAFTQRSQPHHLLPLDHEAKQAGKDTKVLVIQAF